MTSFFWTYRFFETKSIVVPSLDLLFSTSQHDVSNRSNEAVVSDLAESKSEMCCNSVND